LKIYVWRFGFNLYEKENDTNDFFLNQSMKDL